MTDPALIRNARAAGLELFIADLTKLVADLNNDVVTLQQAMMSIWHVGSDDVKTLVEAAMAATGMPRIA